MDYEVAENSLSPRLLKKVQMQGGVTHLRWVPGAEAYLRVRRSDHPACGWVPERANAADGPFSATC